MIRVTPRLGTPRVPTLLALAGLLALLPAAPASALTSELRILVNVDVNPISGCDVNTVDGVFPGVEQILVTTVETTGLTGQVTLVERFECVDEATDTFGPAIPVSAGGWPVGVGLGLDGSDVVETFVGVSDIGGANPPPVLRLGVVADNGLEEDALLVVRPVGNQSILFRLTNEPDIPTLSEWGLMLLALLVAALALGRMRRMRRRHALALLLLACLGISAVAWASVRDGLIDDWLGVSSLAEDPQADAPLGADLRALFAQTAAGEICFRLDVFLEFNQPPDAVDDDFMVDEDSVDNSLDVLANDSDPETDPLTITGVGTPDQGGTATTDGSTITYTPAPDFKGTETFTYTIEDDAGGSDTATVTVTVNNLNDPPDAVDDAFNVAEDSADNVLDVLANDTDAPDMNETLTITAVGMPDQGGTAITDGSTITYTPPADFTGVETFTYTIDDGNGLTDMATVTVTVDNENDPPDAVDDAFMVDEDSTDNSLDVLANDTFAPDVGETLTITAVGMTDQGGTATTDGSTITYTPVANFVGVETFTYTISDGNGGSDVATVTVTVANANMDPPACAADMATTDEDNSTAVDVLANDTDPDPGQTATLTVLSVDTTGTSGTVVNNGTDVTYDPNGQFESLGDGEMDTDSFSYTAQDTDGLTCMATVTVTITGVNDAPTVVNEIFDVAAGNFDPAIGNTTLQFANTDTVTTPHRFVSGDVLDNDTDPENDAFSITAFDAMSVEGGTVTFNLATGEFTYLPPVGFEGVDSFGYTVSDGTASTVGTVTIEVADMVWYLDNDPANDGSGDDGRSSSPFDTIAQFEAQNGGGAMDDPEAGDIIFVFEGTSTYDAGGGDVDGLDLLDQQKLLGEGVDLVVQSLTLVSGNAANQPSIDNTNMGGDAVSVLATAGNRTGIEVRGLSIDGDDNAIEVTSTGANQVGATISDNTIAGSGTEGIDLNPGSSGAFDVLVENNVFSTASAAGTAIDLTTAAASGDVEIALNANTDITSSTSAGIVLDNSAGGGKLFVTGFAGNTVHGNTVGDGIRVLNATFDADPSDTNFTGDEVSGGNTTVGVGNPVGGSAMVLTNVAGDLAFGTLNLSTDGAGAVGLDVTGSGLLNAAAGTGFEISSTGGTVSSADGPAVVLDPLTAGLVFGSVSSASSPTTGVSLTDIAGTFSAAAGSIGTATGTSFNVNGGTPSVIYNGSITHSGNGTRAIEIQSMTGGSATFGGAVSATDGTGIRVANNTGTNTISFTGTVDLGTALSRLSDGDAFTMTGNSAGTTVLAPDVDVFTNGVQGVVASGSGILDLDALSLNTTGNGGRALNLAGIQSLVDVDTATCSNNSDCVTLSALAASSTTTFTGVGLTCTGGTCFNASTARTVEVTGAGNTIGATNAVGLNMASTTIGVNDATFESISASGAANGIVLNATGASGGFNVTGDGMTAGSGGTIQNISADGVRLVNAHDVSLSFMNLTNVATVDRPGGAGSGCFDNDASDCNAGIEMISGSTGLTIDNVIINGSGQQGISGDGVSGFSMTNSQILNAGDGSVIDEGAIIFSNLGGTVLIQDSLLDSFHEQGFRLYNTTASPNITILRTTFSNNVAASDGLQFLIEGGTSTVLVDDSDFNDIMRQPIDVNVEDTPGGILNLTVLNSRFLRGGGLPSAISVATNDDAQAKVTVMGCTMTDGTSTPINIASVKDSTIDVILSNNTTTNPVVTNIGRGIRLANEDGSDMTALLDNNTLGTSDFGAIEILSREVVAGFSNPTLHLTMVDNTMTAGPPNVDRGIHIQSQTAGSTVCLDIGPTPGSGNNTGIGNLVAGIRVNRAAGTFQIESVGVCSMSGAACATGVAPPAGCGTCNASGVKADVEAFIDLFNSSTPAGADADGGHTSVAAGTCRTAAPTPTPP